MNKAVNVFLSTVALFIATGELANAASPGAYIGGGAGLSGSEAVSDAQMLKDSGLGGRAFVGYNFNRYFGVEGSYSTFFKTTYTARGHKLRFSLIVNYANVLCK